MSQPVGPSAHRIAFPVRWEDAPGTLIIDAAGRYVFPKTINALAELIQPPWYRRVSLWLRALVWL